MRENTIKKMLSDYILVQAEIALSFGIIGTVFARDVSISFSYFFLPAILGLICMLPCVVVYLKEDMTVKQVMIQRVVEWIVLELVILWVAYKMVGDVPGKMGYVVMACSILFFDVATYGISYYLERREAADINKKLREIRSREEHKTGN